MGGQGDEFIEDWKTEEQRDSIIDSFDIVSASGGHTTTSILPQESSTALELDAWGLRRGRDLLAENNTLSEQLGIKRGDLVAPGDKMGNLVCTGEEFENKSQIVADLHGAAFEPEPRLMEKCTDTLRHQFIKELLETPEYQSLHASTQLDTTMSEIATAAFTKQYATLVQKDKEARKQDEARPWKEPTAPSKVTPGELNIPVMQAVAGAINEATKEVEDTKDMCASLGGDGGTPGSSLDRKTVAGLHKRIRNSPSLKRICELAGRYRRLAAAKQRAKAIHSQDDMVGVRLDNDIATMLPHEIGSLVCGDEDLELLTLCRLVEKACQCREYSGKEPVGKGPIVVTVDESGSMRGDKIYMAKALALALAWIAKQQRRWCALVGFSGGCEGTRLILPPHGAWNQQGLLDWLEHFYDGGTSMDVPCSEIPNKYWPEFIAAKMERGKTDLVCITDAIVNIPANIEKAFMTWKEAEKVKMYTMLVGGFGDGGDLRRISDEVYIIPSLGVQEEAVGKVLAI